MKNLVPYWDALVVTEYSKEEVIGKKPGSFLQGKKTNSETVQLIRSAISKRSEIDINIINYNFNIVIIINVIISINLFINVLVATQTNLK